MESSCVCFLNLVTVENTRFLFPPPPSSPYHPQCHKLELGWRHVVFHRRKIYPVVMRSLQVLCGVCYSASDSGPQTLFACYLGAASCAASIQLHNLLSPGFLFHKILGQK